MLHRSKRVHSPCQRRGTLRIIRLGGVFAIATTILILIASRYDESINHHDKFRGEGLVSLVIVSDSSFGNKYKTQAKSIECYAKQHGYAFVTLNPEVHAPVCKRNLRFFFFQKHCTVSRWLREQPRGLVAVVLDGDVIGGTSNNSLARWLNYSFDLAFYERCWNFEITSGNYIVRNTPFGRTFLQHWANYDNKLPSGFSSFDNGAIHLAVLEALAVREREKCYDLYRGLDESSTATNLTAYYQFVGCTRRLLGPPRTHTATTCSSHKKSVLKEDDDEEEEIEQKEVGAITIFPRFFGFAVDARVHGFTGFRNLHPFHHGVKSETWWEEYVDYQDSEDFASCKAFSQNRTISDEEMGQRLRAADAYAMQEKSLDFESIPRWEQADANCYDRLWCEPLPKGVDAWPRGLVFVNGTAQQLTYEYPGQDWYNEFANGVKTRTERLERSPMFPKLLAVFDNIWKARKMQNRVGI